MTCRHCGASLDEQFLNLGFAPPSNAYRSLVQLDAPETHFPLRLYACSQCWLVQTQDYPGAEALFNDQYAYFSSVSRTWLAHAAEYATMIRGKLGLHKHSFVVEVASNDGYLLKHFVASAIPCLGIEPTASTASAAELAGIPVIREFFGSALARRLAESGRQADLIVGNNVYAHVPDINDFTSGLAVLLKPRGTVTLEFPHLMRFLKEVQFDTAYHEHFSYLSLTTVRRIFAASGLRVFDVEELPTHGGSLRVYGCHANDPRPELSDVRRICDAETSYGMQSVALYRSFQAKVDAIKNRLLEFLIEQKQRGHGVAGYGAAAKGNTLLNYAGIKPDLLPFICDAAPSKQGQFMPGSAIPILDPSEILLRRPDFVLILPWNIADEIIRQLREDGYVHGRFVVAVPKLRELQ